MKSKSRQGRVEAGNHKRKIRQSTNLTRHPSFGWEPGSFTYNCIGYLIRLRFCQVTGIWTAKCADLEAEMKINHQTPENIEIILRDWINGLTVNLTDDWLTENLPQTEYYFDDWMTRPQAAARQATPACQELAARHNIPLTLADEMMQERGE